MAYNYQAAIQAGADPNDVINYMASQTGYKAQQAVQAGANPQDVMAYMANLPSGGQSSPSNQPSDASLGGIIKNTITGIPAAAANLAQGIFPNKNLGKVIGTGLGGIETALTQPQNLKYYDWNPHASVGGVVGDVAGDAINAASLLVAPETGGTSLLARSGVNAAIGGGLSLANSASQGQNIFSPQSLENAAGSATLSSLLPVLAKPFEALVGGGKLSAGITPQIETALKDSSPQEVQDYIETTLAHNKDLNTPTGTGLVASKLNEAADAITQKLKTAGQAVGDAIKQNGAKLIGPNSETGNGFTDDILSNFNKKLEDTFGHEITYNPEGNIKLTIDGENIASQPNNEPRLVPLPDRSRTIIPSDQNRILAIHKQIVDLADNPSVAKASDVVHNLDDLIDYSKVDQVGINHDPLQGIIRSTRGEINGAIRTTSPEIAMANDRFSQLKDIENEIGEKAGNDLQRSALVMRRVFSGDQSGKSLELLNNIKNETGIDLVKHSALAKFATDNFGDASSRSLLQQELNQGGSMLGGFKRALITPIKNTVGKVLIPDTQNAAMKIAGGGKYVNTLDELIHSSRGRGLLRTYFNNVSAAHPEIGKVGDRSIYNLIGNLVGHQ